MAGPFDFLHIKGRTAGSSNELSFDVLDARRSGIEAKTKAKAKTGAGVKENLSPKPSAPAPLNPKQGSYHNASGFSTLSAEPEVERRKRVRRNRSVRIGAFALVVVVALASAGAYAGMQLYHDQADFTGRFGQLIGRIVEVDRSLVEIDGLMSNPLNIPESDERAEQLDAMSALSGELDSIAGEALDMEQGATGDADRTALEEARAGIEARKSMLTAAESTFTLSVVVNKQASEANDAWNQVLAADTTAREATGLANAASTEKATIEARDKTEEAIEALLEARELLDLAEKEAPGLDLFAEIAYVDKRIESLDAAIETSDALLDADRTAATKANDAYNEADAEATEIAQSLTSPVGEKVKAIYSDDIARIRQSYDAARSAAADADSAVRFYLA